MEYKITVSDKEINYLMEVGGIFKTKWQAKYIFHELLEPLERRESFGNFIEDIKGV